MNAALKPHIARLSAEIKATHRQIADDTARADAKLNGIVIDINQTVSRWLLLIPPAGNA